MVQGDGIGLPCGCVRASLTIGATRGMPIPDLSFGRVQLATTYSGGAKIDDARSILERHAVSSADGMCLSCRVPGPCRENEAAAMAFRLSMRLPRRVPGMTRPELIGARRVDGFGLTARAS